MKKHNARSLVVVVLVGLLSTGTVLAHTSMTFAEVIVTEMSAHFRAVKNLRKMERFDDPAEVHRILVAEFCKDNGSREIWRPTREEIFVRKTLDGSIVLCLIPTENGNVNLGAMVITVLEEPESAESLKRRRPDLDASDIPIDSPPRR